MTTPLPTIVALARAGALDHAWAQFCAAGYDRAGDDPAALTVKGRLLKDHALRSEGEERRRYYLQSAQAYRRAAALRPATYPLINAATLFLLSGERAQAEEAAHEVLNRIAREPDEPETPYWRGATEAEALLLLGRADEARKALHDAVGAAPDAWEDHASTLRQFLLIQAELGRDTAWLDRLRPKRSAHYAADAAAEVPAGQQEAIERFLRHENVGFAYGGLAAGPEIVAAEALLAAGAELHIVLPGDASSFASRFVDPFGADWRRRFDAILPGAASVYEVRPLRTAPDPQMVALARLISRGDALIHAERLLGQALPLPTGLADMAPQTEADLSRSQSGRRARALVALGAGSNDEKDFQDRLDRLHAVLGSGGAPAISPHLSGDCILIGYATPAQAADVARRLHAQLASSVPLRIGAHYGVVDTVRDPFSGAIRPIGSGGAVASEIAASMPPDTVCVSRDFAAVLAAQAGRAGSAAWIGELAAFDGGSAIGLYALSRQA
ncbi:MAG: TRAFs-binding domain-containing protein [Pseudomonadota bacterium]|nr:TRAFs-binding domain-containing protein [Pseudomonadota bacterium]